MRQVTIYRQPGRFAGWPANYGIWCWGDEIVVGFTIGAHKTVQRGHAIDKSQPLINMQARSLDGGASWHIEDFMGARPGGRGLSADEHMRPGLRLAELVDNSTALPPLQPLNFTHPDFALMAARTGIARGAVSFLYASTDRCRTWDGPYRLPMFGSTGIAARTDCLIQGAHSALLFLTANKADGAEGKVICVRTTDGAQSFQLLSEVGGEPTKRGDFAIMPSSLQLRSGRILCTRRCADGATQLSSIDLYASDDNGRSWRFLNTPATFTQPGHSGNPPSLLALPDGRLALIYGNRDDCAICARLSTDYGETWSAEIVLRAGGANSDLGYVRAVTRADGSVVAAYYINDRPDGDGERFIEAAIWQP